MYYNERQLKQAVMWFVHLQSEQCSEQDQQLFEAWLAKDSAHRAAYSKAEQLWGHFDSLKTLENIPALNKARNARAEKLRSSTIASLLFIITLCGVAYTEYSTETLTYTTGHGEHQHIVLADNSQLDLNTNSQLRVKISLLQRQIQLIQGEALFDVSHEWRPFTVQANNLHIRDIGTRFNVHLEPERVAVAVLEGEVELDDGQVVHQQSLSAGNWRVYTKNTGLSDPEAVSNDTVTVTAWLDGYLVFRSAPLQQVTNELERYHSVKFVFVDPELAQETVSGTFDASNLKPFLHAVETMLPVRTKQQGKTILLQHKQKK